MIQGVTVLILILFAGYIALLWYFRNSWCAIPGFKAADGFTGTTFVTVIIPARNEASGIQNCLDSVCQQSYSTGLFEVLVVDDHSSDTTADIVKAYGAPVKLITLKDHIPDTSLNSYKKKAIEVAIGQAKGSLIVTTDADCIVPGNWLQHIVACYEKQQAAFIVMPVVLDCSTSFIEIFQALDFMVLQGVTGAAVHTNKLSMCNGANLAYSKKAFMDAGGFTGIDQIASGDDMLLMHKIAQQNPGKIFFLKSRELIVHTDPMPDLKSFFDQRIRWASKAGKYSDKRIFAVLLLVYLFNVGMLILPILGAISNVHCSMLNIQCSVVELWLWLLLLKTITELAFLYPVAKFFNKQSLLWLFPIMQPFHILYTVIAGLLGSFGSYSWKERRVK